MMTLETVTTENLLKELQRRNIPETVKDFVLFGYAYDVYEERMKMYREQHGVNSGGT